MAAGLKQVGKKKVKLTLLTGDTDALSKPDNIYSHNWKRT